MLPEGVPFHQFNLNVLLLKAVCNSKYHDKNVLQGVQPIVFNYTNSNPKLYFCDNSCNAIQTLSLSLNEVSVLHYTIHLVT